MRTANPATGKPVSTIPKPNPMLLKIVAACFLRWTFYVVRVTFTQSANYSDKIEMVIKQKLTYNVLRQTYNPLKHPSVNGNSLAGNISRHIRCQENAYIGDILCSARAFKRNSLSPCINNFR